MQTLQSWLGIEWPIIQAPMAGVQTGAMAIAVSRAGGLGSLPCAMLTPEALRAELALISAQVGSRVNVNFFCHAPPEPDPARELAWRTALRPTYERLNLDPTAVPAGAGRAPFSQQSLDLIAEFRPAVVSFHFGLPDEHLLRQVRAWGAKVLSSATTVEEAIWLQDHGADAIIAQGLEAGGHRGMFLTDDLSSQIGTMALLPQVIRVARVPVIAAGGIGDARGVAAALSMGAAGVQVGTSYLLCEEATTSAVHRAALQSEAARHTALTNLFTGRPARGIMNRIMRELGPISASPPEFPLATAAMAPLRAACEARGLGDCSPLWSGQNASGCRAVGAAEMTRALAGLA
jgi:nitronate monooxygenase